MSGPNRWSGPSPSGDPTGGPGWGGPFGGAARRDARADRWRIWREPDQGWVAGVCAGIADNLGIRPGLVRAAAVVGLVFFTVPTAIGYLVLALALKPKPPALFADPAQEAFWRGLRSDPMQSLAGLRDRLAALDRRLGRAETLVASDEFELRRGFRDLGA
jgi:phage shock protein C